MKNINQIDNFLKYLSVKGVSNNSLKFYKSDINHFLTWLGKRKLNRLSVKEYLNEFELISPKSTMNRRLSSLRAFSAFLGNDFMSDVNNLKKVSSLSKVSGYRKIQEKIINKFQDRPRIKNIFDTLFFRRPRWYQTYHSYPLSNYLHLAILIIFSGMLSFAIYDNVFKNTNSTLAYPTTLTRPNRYLSFQGRLTTASGNPITTATNVVFKLYDASSGGSQLWTSGTCSITPDSDGIFSTLLGTTTNCPSATEIDAAVFSENASVWVGVTVGADAEATPRIQIATVGYALNSETLQGFPAGTGTSTIPYINSSGTVVLANASPKIQSTSGTFSVEGQALTINTPNSSNGVITINPDGTGTLDLTFEGAAAGGSVNGFVNATNANITSGSLYAGTVASNATGYNFINFLSGSSPTSKFSVNNAGNTTMAGDLTVTGDDIYMTTNTAGMILIADGTNFNPTAVSGDITINGSGVTAIGDDKVTEADLKVVDTASDEECLTYETTTGDFEWQSCSAGGMTSFTLAGDTGSNQTISNSDTMSISGGINGIDTVGSATDVLTVNLDTTEIGSTTFGSGSAISWGFDASAGTDTSIAFGDNSQTFTTATGTFSGNLVVQGTTGLTFNTGAGGDITFANGEKIDNDTDGTVNVTTGTLKITNGANIVSDQTTVGVFDSTTTTLNIGSAATTINLADAAITGTIDIGGVTNSGTTTVNIATQGTAADTIAIGNSNSSTLLSLTGGDDWSMTSTGILTMSASAAQTTAIVATDTDYTNALSIGDNNIIGTTGGIDFTNFDVDSSGNTTIANQGDIRLMETTGGGTEYVGLQAADTMTSSTVYKLPNAFPAGASGYYLTSNTSGDMSWSNSIAASSLKWNALTAPDGALTLAHGTNATTFGWTPTGALDAFTMNIVNNGGSSTNQNGLVINNAVAGSFSDTATESLLKLQQLDTTAAGTTAVTDALLIDSGGASGIVDAIHISNTVGNITNGIDISDTTGTIDKGIVLSGTFTTAGIDMGNSIITNIGNAGTDFDSNGGLTLAGDLTITGGNITNAVTADSTFTVTGTFDANGDVTIADTNVVFDGATTTFTTTGDLTINSGGGQVIFSDADTINIGGLTGVAYNAFANSGEAPEEAGIADDNDAYIGGNLEVDGTIYGTVNGDLTCVDCLDFTDFADYLTLDVDTIIEAPATKKLYYNKAFADATSESGLIMNFYGSDTSSGTTDQHGLYLDNAVSTEGVDSLIALNNTDSDDAVGNAILFTAGGSGTDFTYGINFDAANIGTAEIVLENAETIDNQTDGTIAFSGILTVNGTSGTGIDITNTGITTDLVLQNDETIDNNTNGTITITSPITSLSGDLVVGGGDIDNSAGTSTIFLNSTPSSANSFHKLYNGSWLVQNAINDGIAALMVDQTKAADIFTASASGTTKFTISNTGLLTLANGETIDNTVNDVVTFGVGGSSEIALSASSLYPSTNDGTALGILTSNQWSDLFLASGAVINYNNDVTLTHATDSLTIAGGVTTLTGSADGTDSLILTAGDILISNGDLDLSGGDFNVILDAADTALIDGDTNDKTADGLLVDLGTLTDGVDGIVSDLNVTGNTASDADTFSALRLIAANNATDQATDDNIYGLIVANLGGTALAGNEYAIYQEGEAWDYGLYTQDAIYIDDNASFRPTTSEGFDISNSVTSGFMASINSTSATQAAAAYGLNIDLGSFTDDATFNSFGLIINGPDTSVSGSEVHGGLWIQEIASGSNSDITRDITLQNGEYIENDVNNTINLASSITAFTGYLDVNGGDGSDFAGSVTFNDDVVLTLTGNENLALTSDLSASVNMITLIGTPSSTAATINGISITQQSSTNTNGIDRGIFINNADDGLAITTGILFGNSGGGGYTNYIDTADNSFIVSAAGNITAGGDITVTGNGITFGNGETIDNNTSDTISLKDGGGTGLISVSTTLLSLNLTSTDQPERLCHGGADASRGFVEVGDCAVAGADFAEYSLVSDSDAEPGDLVYTIGNDPQDSTKTLKQKSSYPYQNITGVISTNPFVEILGETHYKEDGNSFPIALRGKAPVKVSLENGPISVGDPLVASSVSGVAMKGTNAGEIIGFAEENYDGSVQISDHVINQEVNWARNRNGRNELRSDPSKWNAGVGKIIVDVNPHYYDPALALNSSGDVSLTTESGNIILTDNRTNTVINKIAAFKELIAGKIKSGKVETNVISPIANTDLIIDLQPDNSLPASQLAIKGENDEVVASIDAQGKVTANDLEVNNDATVSGTLYADKIESTKLNDIEKLLKDVESNQNILAQSNTWDINTNSQFTDLSSVNFQTTNLFVTSQAAISSLLVSDSLSSKNINSLDTTLSIQSLALNSVEIMAGKIKIDTLGNTKFEGDVDIAGKLTVDKFVVANANISTPSGELIGSNEVTSNAIAGYMVLPANTVEVKINNSNIKSESLIYVTPTSSTQNKVLYVKSKDVGTFTVGFNEAIDTDVQFNWWIIELENGSI